MTSTQKTLECLDQQIQDDLQTMVKLMEKETAGENVTRELDELENAIDVKMALAGGLRREG